jgi:hypothetical protein
VLDALDAGSAITLVASRPATHMTLQFKAAGAERVGVNTAHKRASARCLTAFGAELAGLGYGDDMAERLAAIFPTDQLAGLRFAPDVVFDQTPGPQAGKVLAHT